MIDILLTLGKERVRHNGRLVPARKAQQDFAPIKQRMKEKSRRKSDAKVDVTTGVNTIWYQCDDSKNKAKLVPIYRSDAQTRRNKMRF